MRLRKYDIHLVLLAIWILGGSAARGEIGLPSGYEAELWLSGMGDLRGVSLGQGGTWCNDVYVASQQSILRVTGKGTTEVVTANLASDRSCKIAFDTSGLYGGDMFVSAPRNGDHDTADLIYRVSPDGETSVFFENSEMRLLTNGISFGKGNGFGTSLYIQNPELDKLVQVNDDGSYSLFGSGVMARDWEDDLKVSADGPFGNYAYMTCAYEEGFIYRMAPSGVNEVFATGVSGLALAFGEGAFGDRLFLGSGAGEIWAYEPDGSATLFASGFSGSIRGLDISGDVMWLTVTGGGELYRISIVPEPATVLLLGLGAVSFLRRLRI